MIFSRHTQLVCVVLIIGFLNFAIFSIGMRSDQAVLASSMNLMLQAIIHTHHGFLGFSDYGNKKDLNITRLTQAAGQPTLFKRILWEALPIGNTSIGNQSEIKETGPQNKTAFVIEQEQIQAMTNSTLDDEMRQRKIITFKSITRDMTNNETVKLLDKFGGLYENKQYGPTPPDVTLGVGPFDLVEMVNSKMAIWLKPNHLIGYNPLREFFVAGADYISDPRIFYDNESKRWFASILDKSNDTVLVAISTTLNATGNWYIYKFPFNNCPDQPFIGVSRDKFIVSANTIPRHCNLIFVKNESAQFTVADKDDLLKGVRYPKFVQSIPDREVLSLHPLESMHQPVTSDLRILSVNQASVILLSLKGALPRITSSVDFLVITVITDPPNVIQPSKNQPTLLELRDNRILDAKGYKEKAWFTFSEGCKPSGDKYNRSCIRLIELDLHNKAIMEDFDVAINGSYLFFPALAVDNSGDLEVVYGVCNEATLFPSLAVSQLPAGHPPNDLTQPDVLKYGSAISQENAFGDYFAATTDTYRDGFFWVAGQYASPSTKWATFIGSLEISSASSNSTTLLRQVTPAVGPAVSNILRVLPLQDILLIILISVIVGISTIVYTLERRKIPNLEFDGFYKTISLRSNGVISRESSTTYYVKVLNTNSKSEGRAQLCSGSIVIKGKNLRTVWENNDSLYYSFAKEALLKIFTLEGDQNLSFPSSIAENKLTHITKSRADLDMKQEIVIEIESDRGRCPRPLAKKIEDILSEAKEFGH